MSDLLPPTPKPPARNEQEVRERHESNRAAWNQGAAAYTAGNDERIEFLRSGQSNVHPVERSYLGDLARIEAAIHLQCASGGDTLSLLNEGVRRVVGIDISDSHIDNARYTATALDAPAEFVRCDVLDVPDRFAGGIVSIFDGHPITWLFEPEASTLVPSGLRYLDHAESSKGWPDTYIGDLGLAEDELAEMEERSWPPSAVFTALVGAGLVVEHFGEHAEGYWSEFPNLGDELRDTLPLTYSFAARKPSANA